MKLDKFTRKTAEVLESAQNIALEFHHQELNPFHILSALLTQEDSIIPQILSKIGVNTQNFQTRINDELSNQPQIVDDSAQGQIYLSREVNSILLDAEKEAKKMGDEFVASEHILLAMCNIRTGSLSKLFKEYNITKDSILSVLKSIRGNQRITDQEAESTYQALQKFSRDITELAKQGKLDPVIGRDDEIRRVIQVLSRRTKNNPVLIG
jgi:ATP-dependent Clp protease ATP-binding subunit ClpB